MQLRQTQEDTQEDVMAAPRCPWWLCQNMDETVSSGCMTMGTSHAQTGLHPQRGQRRIKIVLLLCRPMRHPHDGQLVSQVHGLALYEAIAAHTVLGSATCELQRRTKSRPNCHAKVAISQARS